MNVHAGAAPRGPTIRPEYEAEAAVTFSMRCATCGAASDREEDFTIPHGWSLRHVTLHPGHLRFREVIHRTWRAEAAP
ncbi:hypothetical protein [Streptomyces sp. I05A-00742]|uniref:DUF7848 domain-containing protein n=1 Tax=Streptomyces sp. I05A-00742 TaxID=2732853 RepID=UPI0014886366|nr:hypothetical protein [Streptomyces sp. I05A-00742]